MEVIDLGALDDLEPISLDVGGSNSGFNSSKFGSGIELLMNDKKITTNSNSNLNLGELDNLENELNELSGQNKHAEPSSGNTKTLTGMAANLFGFGKKEEPSSAPIKVMEDDSGANLGQATRSSMGTAKTWDGFSKMNEIPLNAEKATTLSEREVRRKKRAMIKKLDEWYENYI